MASRWKQRIYTGLTKFGESRVARRVAGAVESCDWAFENDNSDHETNPGSRRNVQTRNIALTLSESGSLTMYLGSYDTLATAVENPLNGGVEVTVDALTGDSYCEQEGIDVIGLLKVDAEGHDLAVLNGFGSMLATGRVDVVQFEFTLFAVYARTWLRDFYDLLTPYGYRIGKLYPTRVAWRDYDAHDERFLRCNFVAVRPEACAAKALGWTAD